MAEIFLVPSPLVAERPFALRTWRTVARRPVTAEILAFLELFALAADALIQHQDAMAASEPTPELLDRENKLLDVVRAAAATMGMDEGAYRQVLRQVLADRN